MKIITQISMFDYSEIEILGDLGLLFTVKEIKSLQIN